MTSVNRKNIFFSPPSYHYEKNKLFDDSNINLNRDGGLKVFLRAKSKLEERGLHVNTADLLETNPSSNNNGTLYSFGSKTDLLRYSQMTDIVLESFVLFEPPVVDPELYSHLPQLTQLFKKVYIHNTHGDGYSLQGVDQSKLRKLHWPQPFENVLTPYWNNTQRLNRIVVINGNHRPHSKNQELYSERMKAMRALSKFHIVDLYGRGWNRWWSGNSRWLPYWKNILALKKIYKGACDSKYEVLSKYRFCLCFENMRMNGYITEKIFDCFYAGTIPIYLGASDIEKYIPKEAYIDGREFKNWQDLWPALQKLSLERLEKIKNAGKEFIRSKEGQKYIHFIEDEICQ